MVNSLMFRMRTKLTLAFVGLSIVSIIAISIFANFLLERQFRQYIIEKHQDRNKEIVNQISQQYTREAGWNVSMLQNIGVNAIHQGLIIRVKDIKGNTIWDAIEYNFGMCQMMINHIEHNMTSRYPNWKGEYVEDSYPISNMLRKIGLVEIGYYGPFYFNDKELDFINTINKAIVLVALLLMILSIILGAVLSKSISKSIEKVIETALRISKGDYKARSDINSSTFEIQQLAATVNDLAVILDKQEVLRRRLTEDVAHELRTPMATLQSHLEAMIDGIWEPTSDRLKSCHEEIIRINKMIGDISKLARYERENLILEKSSFDTKELVHNIVLNFEGQFRAKKIAIAVRGENIEVYADKDKISQVLVNLISNSYKYTEAGGRLDIEISNTSNKVSLSIKDTGQGISAEDLPHIFERFYRADKSRNRTTGGAGIGLAIAKAIIEAHGGTIEVSSEVNKGSEFIVTIPINNF